MKEEEFKKILADYAEAMVLKRACEKRIEEIGPRIKEKMLNEAIDKYTSQFGNFTLKYVPVYTYSPAVKAMLDEVDNLKAAERANGVATSIIRNDLMFKKDEKE